MGGQPVVSPSSARAPRMEGPCGPREPYLGSFGAGLSPRVVPATVQPCRARRATSPAGCLDSRSRLAIKSRPQKAAGITVGRTLRQARLRPVDLPRERPPGEASTAGGRRRRGCRPLPRPGHRWPHGGGGTGGVRGRSASAPLPAGDAVGPAGRTDGARGDPGGRRRRLRVEWVGARRVVGESPEQGGLRRHRLKVHGSDFENANRLFHRRVPRGTVEDRRRWSQTPAPESDRPPNPRIVPRDPLPGVVSPYGCTWNTVSSAGWLASPMGPARPGSPALPSDQVAPHRRMLLVPARPTEVVRRRRAGQPTVDRHPRRGLLQPGGEGLTRAFGAARIGV